MKLEGTEEIALKAMSSERESILGSLGVVRLPSRPCGAAPGDAERVMRSLRRYRFLGSRL